MSFETGKLPANLAVKITARHRQTPGQPIHYSLYDQIVIQHLSDRLFSAAWRESNLQGECIDFTLFITPYNYLVVWLLKGYLVVLQGRAS